MKRVLLVAVLLSGCAMKDPEMVQTINAQGELLKMISVYVEVLQANGYLPTPKELEEEVAAKTKKVK